MYICYVERLFQCNTIDMSKCIIEIAMMTLTYSSFFCLYDIVPHRDGSVGLHIHLPSCQVTDPRGNRRVTCWARDGLLVEMQHVLTLPWMLRSD